MANRRMFSKIITNSSAFLMMPPTSRLLYYDLGMQADDDGFVEHFGVMRMTEAKPDDLRVLEARGFVKVFDDKVLIISDWKENNYIQKDRYTPSKYLEVYKDRIQNVYKLDTQDRLGKDTILSDSDESEDIIPVDEDGNELNPSKKKKVTKEIQQVFDVFIDQPARTAWKLREIERVSAWKLYQDFGIEELKKRYEIIRKHRGDHWCPQIDSPSDLLGKMPKMEKYLKLLQS